MVEFKKRDFDEFVKRQRELSATKNAPPFDWKKELAFWLKSLDELYSTMIGFLTEYVDDGAVLYQLEDITLNEEFSGEYKAKSMLLQIGLKQIRVVPIGTMLIGSRGRVDIIGEASRSRLVLINAKITSPRQLVQVRVVDPTKPIQPNTNRREDIEWVWKFIGSSPSSTFIDFTKESFLSSLLEVSNA
jgi:hypothetical protein